jgi:hypothetical protein
VAETKKTCGSCGSSDLRPRSAGRYTYCRPCVNRKQTERRRANPDYWKSYRERPGVRARAAERMREWTRRNPAKARLNRLLVQDRLRADILRAYGAKCSCCAEGRPQFLSIDHVNKDGAAHRRAIKTNLHSWLRANGFPKHGFRLLCFNCNLGLAFSGFCHPGTV